MKKILFVLALVAAYGVSIAMTSPSVVTIDNAKVTIVADVNDNNVTAPEGDKEKEKAKAKTSKAKGEGCSSTKAKACSGEKAKADCNSKSKADCEKSCDEKKK